MCPGASHFFVGRNRIFAGILCGFQKNSVKHGGKRAGTGHIGNRRTDPKRNATQTEICVAKKSFFSEKMVPCYIQHKLPLLHSVVIGKVIGKKGDIHTDGLLFHNDNHPFL